MKGLIIIIAIICNSQIKAHCQNIFEHQNCNGRPLFLENITSCKEQKKPMFFTTALKYRQGIFYTTSLDILADICYYQHPSWSKGGTLGKFVIEPFGDIYCVPVPYINNYYNEYSRQNILYKIESQTGVMDSVLNFAGGSNIGSSNPFGLMGLTYDCSGSSLYVSTIAGSRPESPKGKIYKLEISVTDELIVKDSIENIDALSLAVVSIDGVKRLLYGEANHHTVKSIILDKNGNFTKFINQEIDLNDPKFMSSHKAVHLKFVSDNVLEVSGAYFDYTLSIPGSHEKNTYTFKWNNARKKWDVLNIELKE